MKLTKIALGVALVAGSVGAQAAGQLFFPHVVVSGTVTTIATVVNVGAADPAGQHWIYVGKNLMAGETVADFNAKTCSEVDVMLPTSDNNIQTVDLGAVISKPGDYGVIFNDPSIKNQWRQTLGGGAINYSLAHAYMTPVGAAGTRGYLVVEEGAGAGTLEGSALVFDYKTGSAWGYKAEELADAVAAHAHAAFSAHLMPKAEVINRLMITPLADAEADMLPGGATFGAWGVTVAPQMVGTGHIVDRDENPISGAANSAVTCVGTVDVWDILAPGAAQFAPDGGWVSVLTAAAAAPLGAAARAEIFQLDFGGQGATTGTLNGVSYPGTWNNVYQAQ